MALVRGRPLVGRRTQLEVLERRLAEARQGHGGVIFIAGEPGIGKTTLAGALADAAQGAGITAIWGRCRETGGAPPYWPWVQVVRWLLHGHADLPVNAGVDTDHLLALSLPGATQSGSRFRLYEAVGALLRAAGESRGGLLVVLDDIHRADEPSLALLRYLTAGLADARALVVCCHRDTDLGPSHPLLEVLASAESTASSLMHLPGLQATETAELVATFCGEALSGQVAPAIAARSGGNPLFVVEIARLVQAGGPGAAAAVPTTVREVIRTRLAGLPPETNRALVAAAVLGRSFAVRLLAAVLETSELATVAALQPAAAVYLISPDPDARSTYRFAHAVVQETLYEQLPVELRTSLHAKAADVLDAGGDDDDDAISEIAFHRYHAALAGDVAQAVAATMSAGRRAAARLAYEEADRWLTLSLQLAGRAEGVDRLALLLEAGDVSVRGGRRREARARFESAAALARGASDARALASAALGAGTTVVTAGTVDWPLVRLLEEAAAETDDPSMRTKLLSRRAVELYWQRRTESVSLSAEALEVAERSGDDRAIGVALHARQFTLRGPDHLAERVQIGERLVGLAGRLDDLDLEFEAHTWLAADVLRTGDIGRFLSELDALEGVAERSREPLHRWYAQVYAAELAGLRGRATEASRIADDAAELGRRLQLPVARAYRIAQRAVADRDLGTLTGLEPDVRQAIEEYRYFPTLRAVLALLLAETGRTAEARAEIDHLAAGEFAAVPRDALWTATIALLGEAAALVESVHREQLGALLEPHAGEILVHGIPACWGAADRVRGVLASAAERWTEADAAFSAALATHRRIGAPGWEARTALDRARTLLRREERSAAAAAAREAADKAGALGLEGIRAPAEILLAAVTTSGPRLRLSRRELQVLALLASGASNKEIAAKLVVSIHTVERHLANIYTKVGARSRSDASAFAVRHGLV